MLKRDSNESKKDKMIFLSNVGNKDSNSLRRSRRHLLYNVPKRDATFHKLNECNKENTILLLNVLNKDTTFSTRKMVKFHFHQDEEG